MYPFKVINLSIQENIFNDICFLAINDAKMQTSYNQYIPITINSNILEVPTPHKLNYNIINNINKYMQRKNYINGKDYTINIYNEK